jgi:oligosaccharyltransferase complex subunit beta
VIAFPRGVGHTLGNASPLLVPVLRAPRTAYAYNPKDEADFVEEPFAVGQQLGLVSALQARNSARFTVLGAVEMLSNDWFDASVKHSLGEGGARKGAKSVKTSNRAFAKEISAWTFSETGVLKVGRIEHYLNTGNATSREVNPEIYRVKNDVVSLSPNFYSGTKKYALSNWNTTLDILNRAFRTPAYALRPVRPTHQ